MSRAKNHDERICLPYVEMNRTDVEKDVLYAKTIAYQSGGANPAFYSSGVSERIVFTKATAIQHYADYFMQNGMLAPYEFNARIVSQFEDNRTFLMYS